MDDCDKVTVAQRCMFAIFVLDGIGALLALGGSIIGCMGVCCTGQVVSDMFPRQLYSCFLGCQTPPPPITTPPLLTHSKEKLFVVRTGVGFTLRDISRTASLTF